MKALTEFLNESKVIKSERIMDGLKNRIDVYFDSSNSTYSLVYKTDDIETFTREMIKELGDSFLTKKSGMKITLYTNAGTDLHSSEKELNNVIVKRLSAFKQL